MTTVNYDYTSDQPEAVPYTWVSNVKTWIESSDDYSSYADPEVFYEDVTSNSSEAKAFYSDLAAAIKGSQITLDATATQTTTGTASYPVTEAKLQSTATFTDCEMGTYLVLIENGYRVYTPSVVNLTPEYNTTDKEWVLASNVDVEVKSTTPQITKTVTDTTSTKDNYNVTDEITYTIIADIPNYEEGSLAKNYYISDTLNDGLNLVSDSIEVYGVKGSVEEKLTSGYTQGTTRPNNLGDATFSLEFTYSDISSYEKIKVVYKATLDKSDKTVIGSEGNKNTAYLDYSNNPYDATSYQTQESSENTVYTYGIEISKIDKTSKVALTGAEFTLSKSNDNLYFVKTADGIYYQANSTDTGATTNLVVDGNGKLYLYGLDEGTYSLTETKAPEGYNISVTASTITITDSNLDGALDDEDGTTGIYKLTVTNTQGFTLPITGGIGTTIFAAAGIE